MQNPILSSGNISRVFITGLLLFAAFHARAQTSNKDWPDILAKNVKQFTQTFVPHKVHLHLARSFYAPTDTVWFKTYLTDAASLMPVRGPEVVTITLLSETKKQALTHKVATTNGLAAGHLVLPDSLLPGTYTLTAYTNWMRNFSPEFFFKQTITVYKPFSDDQKTAPKPDFTLAAFRFFPEGGNMVMGVPARVAFKALNAEGLGMAVEGRIVDQSGRTITTFGSLHAGMGSFIFTPAANQQYTAQVTYGNKQQRSYSLPKAIASGLALAVQQPADSIAIIRVAASPDRANEKVYVAVQSRGFIIYLEELKAGKAAANQLRIPHRTLRDGIVQVTVFNAAGKPEAERLFFVNNHRRLNVQISPDKGSYHRRETVNVSLKVTDENGRPLQTELSVGATDLAQENPPGAQENILTSFLLTSDLTGYIENPGVYFENKDPKTREALDNLLLTQGWRRFTWQQVAEAERLKPAYKREPEMVLRGTVMQDKYAVGQALVNLLDQNTGESDVIMADDKGKFSIYSAGNKPTQHYSFQVWQNDKFIRNARLIPDPEPEIVWEQPMVKSFPDSLRLNRNARRSQIEKAYGLKAGKPGVIPVIKSNWLTMAPDKRYVLEKYESVKDLEELLKVIIPEVRVLTATAQPETRMVSKDKRDFFPKAPMYFIDGQPTWNDDLILRLNADLVKEVQIYNSAISLRQFGAMGKQGVLAIHTKAGNFSAPELTTQYLLEVPGIKPAREFYVPAVNPRLPQAPDLRPILYWNASVKTDSNGNATVTFPTSDALSNFRIYAEGITAEGTIGNGSADLNTVPAQ